MSEGTVSTSLLKPLALAWPRPWSRRARQPEFCDGVSRCGEDKSAQGDEALDRWQSADGSTGNVTRGPASVGRAPPRAPPCAASVRDRVLMHRFACPTELVFDRGIGDLAVIAPALRYSTRASCSGAWSSRRISLDTPVILVMGRSALRAVNAAIQTIRVGVPLRSHPVDRRRVASGLRSRDQQSGDLLDNMIRAQTKLTVGRIRHDPLNRGVHPSRRTDRRWRVLLAQYGSRLDHRVSQRPGGR